MSRFLKSQGFTLIELLVVILIIGILIAVSAPSFLGQTHKAHDSATKQYLTVAYKDAAASATDREGDFTTSSFTAAQLATAIQASEPALTVAATTGSDSCPSVALGQPDTNIYIDTTASSGNNLTLCADPNNRVWTLQVANGVLQPFGSAPYTASGGGSSSTDATATVDPSGTVTPGGGNTDCFLDCNWVISDPPAPTGPPNTITITLPPGTFPVGTDPTTIGVSKNGTDIPPCLSPGVADPDPCIDSETLDGNGNIVIVVLTKGDSGDVYAIVPPAGAAFPFSGDTPNNAAGAPSNDDFSHARVLSGGSGSVTGTLVGATVENADQTIPEYDASFNDNGSVDDMGWGANPTRSVWYAWQAPANGVYSFDTLGSPAPMWGDPATADTGAPVVTVWKGTKWPDTDSYHGTASDPAMFSSPWNSANSDMQVNGSTLSANQENIHNGDYSRWDTQVKFTATSGTWYAIQVTNAASGCHNNAGGSCPDQGGIKLNWAPFVDLDPDGDGVNNPADNCPDAYNPNQADNASPSGAGSDGIGDACQRGVLIIHNSSSYPVKFPYTNDLSFSQRKWSVLDGQPDILASAPPCAAGSTCQYDTGLGAVDVIMGGDTGNQQKINCTQVAYSDNGIDSRDNCESPFDTYTPNATNPGIQLYPYFGSDTWNAGAVYYEGGPNVFTITNSP
jgi:general secretion pathway protein G